MMAGQPSMLAESSLQRLDVMPIDKPADLGRNLEEEELMKVVRGNDAKREQGGTFTGEASLRRLLSAQQPGGMAASVVHFEDGARTHWHTHPGEQILLYPGGAGASRHSRRGGSHRAWRRHLRRARRAALARRGGGPVHDPSQHHQRRPGGVVRSAGVSR